MVAYMYDVQYNDSEFTGHCERTVLQAWGGVKPVQIIYSYRNNRLLCFHLFAVTAVHHETHIRSPSAWNDVQS